MLKARSAAANGAPWVTVEAGGSLWPRGRVADDERDQRLAKAALIAKAWGLGGIDAVALSETDWTMGADTLRALVTEARLPVLAANLVCGADRPFPASTVVERSGWKIGIVGVTAGTVDGCAVEAPLPAITLAFAALPPVDLRVLLWPDAQAAKLQEGQLLPTDLVVDASGRANERLIGGAWGLATGGRGKFVGIAKVDAGSGPLISGDAGPVDQEVTRLEKQLADAEARVAKTEGPQKIAAERRFARLTDDMQRARERRDQWSRAMAGPHRAMTVETVDLAPEVGEEPETMKLVVDTLAKFGAVPVAEPRVTPPGSPFAGVNACESCHVAESRQWAATGHAKAWASLVVQHRAGDAECFSCHATGVNQPGGPTNPADVRGFRDVQCESCHGAARQHIADPKVNKTSVISEVTCRECHGTERDEGRFDYATYLPRVKHGPSEISSPRSRP